MRERRNTLRLAIERVCRAASIVIAITIASNANVALAQTQLKMLAWNYQVDTVNQFVRNFEAQNPDIKVDLEIIPAAQYIAKVLLAKNSNTPFDVLYVFDDNVAQWSTWLEPLDGYEGADKLKAAMLPLASQSMTYNGKLYGLPYYTAYFGLIYNTKMMRLAGFSGPPKTYGEWVAQAKAIKDKGISKTPMIWPVKWTGWGGTWVWASMSASQGAHLFDDSLNITPKALEVLKWWTATYREGLSDPANVVMDEFDASRAFSTGEYYTMLTANLFAGPSWVNKKPDSKVAGDAVLGPLPETGSTVGYARLYAMSAASKNKQAAWRLLRFLGGQTPDGVYLTPRSWVQSDALGWGYKGLEQDPVIAAALRSVGADPASVAAGLDNAQHMSRVLPFQTPWYSEWDKYANGVLQDVFSGNVSPEEAARALSERAKAAAARYK